MVTKNILIILTAQDPKHIEPHNALPAFPRQDPLVEKKTYYTELANQVVSKVRLLDFIIRISTSGAIPCWTYQLNKRVGMLFRCSAFLLYHVV